MEKIIKRFDLDLSDLPAATKHRKFTILGDYGAEFILEIKNEDDSYYNFHTNAFQAGKTNLEKTIEDKGTYTSLIVFPTVTDNDHYDIYLTAKLGTKHVEYNEVRFADNSVDINSSTGSDSLIMQKIIYQYTPLTLTLQGYSIGSTVAGTFGTTAIEVDRGNSYPKTAFSFTTTAGATAAYRILRQPTSDDVLSFVQPVVGAAPEKLPGENTSSDTVFYQWPVNNINKIKPGMILVPGGNGTADSIVSSYQDVITIFANTEKERSIIQNSAPAVNTKSQSATVVDGLVTVQPGNIVFDKQQILALAGDTLKIGGYGEGQVLDVHGYNLKFTDLAIALTAPTTTTTAVSNNSTTLTVADREGVINSVSRVGGIGIDSSVQNPLITSGGGADGAGAWTAGATQTLESGVTLTVENTGRVATITGNIEVINAGTADATLRFDVNNLLSTSAP